jgi:hypothetical protein
MWTMLGRVVVVVFGLLIVADIGRPLTTEEVTVSRKTLELRLDWPVLREISATVYFGEGTKRSCTIDLPTYLKLNKGDVVTVSVTHTLRSCVSITRGDEVIDSGRFWKWTTGLGGVVVILLGLFIKPSNERRYEVEL